MDILPRRRIFRGRARCFIGQKIGMERVSRIAGGNLTAAAAEALREKQAETEKQNREHQMMQ
jgi:hypothetical protein